MPGMPSRVQTDAERRRREAGVEQSKKIPRFLQIRLGKESCDQISASPNSPIRAKSRDKTAGSLFTRAYTLVKSVKLKGVSSRFITKHTKTNDTSTSLSFTQNN